MGSYPGRTNRKKRLKRRLKEQRRLNPIDVEFDYPLIVPGMQLEHNRIYRIRLKDVIINPTAKHKQPDVLQVIDTADKIKRNYDPVLISPSRVLIQGFWTLKAAQYLGWNTIIVTIDKNLEVKDGFMQLIDTLPEFIDFTFECVICHRKQTFNTETKEDAWYSADMEGWESTDKGDFCPQHKGND